MNIDLCKKVKSTWINQIQIKKEIKDLANEKADKQDDKKISAKKTCT